MSKNNCKFLELVPSGKTRFQSIILKIEDSLGYWYNISLDHLRNRKMYYTLKFMKNPYVEHNIHLWCRLNRPDYEFCSKEFTTLHKKYLFKYVGNEIELTESDRYFLMSFSNFIYDYGAHPLLKKYRKSYGSFLVREYLRTHEIQFTEEQTFADLLSKRKAHLFFDFYLPIYNTAIEVDGVQHFQPIECFGGEKGFEASLENDQIKNLYCKINNIKLIRIPYFLYGTKREPCYDYLEVLEEWFDNRE